MSKEDAKKKATNKRRLERGDKKNVKIRLFRKRQRRKDDKGKQEKKTTKKRR